VYNNLAHLLLMAGRVPEAIETARTGATVAGKAGLSRTVGAIMTLNLAGALVIAGRWEEADTALVEALAADPPGPLAAAMHGVRGRIALYRGDLTAATDEATHALALSPGGPESVSVRHVVAEVELAEGRLAEARAAVDAGLVMFPDCDDAGARWLLLVSGARVEALARLRARTLGEPVEGDRVEVLRATAATIPVDTPLMAAFAAWFAAELGDAPWPEVVAAWDAVGAPVLAGYARVRAAEAALGGGERTAAEAWLREAADQARALGAGPLLAEIQKLARGAGAALEEAPDQDVSDARRLGLTEREIEVLRLLVVGRSNREIATLLYISPKTASVHVSHILAKLGVANRVEATAAAYRLGLVS